MTVRAQKDVDLLHLFFSLGAHRIAHDPGIDNDDLARGSLDSESRVPQPREFDVSQIHIAPGSWILALSS
jgi:hypothetical protein